MLRSNDVFNSWCYNQNQRPSINIITSINQLSSNASSVIWRLNLKPMQVVVKIGTNTFKFISVSNIIYVIQSIPWFVSPLAMCIHFQNFQYTGLLYTYTYISSILILIFPLLTRSPLHDTLLSQYCLTRKCFYT